MGDAPNTPRTRLLIGPWITRPTADGVVYYRSNEERSVAGLQLRLRQQPTRPFKELLAEQLEGMSRYVSAIEVRAVEELITTEGEYGAFTSITGIGIADNKPLLCVLAVVCGDDCYDRFDGWMLDASSFAEYLVIARDAVSNHLMTLGQRRARRFYYAPPDGWQALQRGSLVQWFPLDYPKHSAVITVPPAFPNNILPNPTVETLMGRRFVSFQKQGEPSVETVLFNGLGGVFRHDIGHYEVEGLFATHMITAALVDPDKTMTYVVRLETTNEYLEADKKQLYNVCRSIRPVPIRSTKTVDSALQMMWSE